MNVQFVFKKSTTSVSGHHSISTADKSAMLVVQNNRFFNIMDHLAPSICNKFSDSHIAKQFTCGRTKTAATVNCIGDYFFENLKGNKQNLPFSLMLNGSNDTGIQNMFPVTFRIYDIQFSRIMTKFFDMKLLERVTASLAESMFSSVDDLFSKHSIPWDYCMAIGLDNANANIGEHNSIKSRAREKMTISSLLGVHATFYIMHLQKLVMHLTKPLGLTYSIIVLILLV